jgi:hydrogenase nickel incorporation protein HypA/HybF
MHEFSICRNIVETVLAELDKQKQRFARLKTTRIIAGALRQIVPENLRFAYEVLTKDTKAEGSTLEIEIRPVTGTCSACGWQGEVERSGFFCAVCRAPIRIITGGKELFLDSLEIDEDEDEDNGNQSISKPHG